MNFLSRALQDEEFHYSSSKPKTVIVEELHEMFSKDLHFSFRKLSGGFISDDKFVVTKQTAPNYPGKRNSLEGKIVQENDKVIVEVVVKAVPYIYLEIFAPIFFGFVILAYVFYTYGRIDQNILIYALIIMLGYPLIMLLVGQRRKNELRKFFVDALDLTSL